ncbi:MAG TPA: sigma-70 family RNA polymerase sigma factor [Verrucomicrobiae bacterium]|jgi:RNA polymerase sigma-70 factor (ECF subfamily)
MDEPDYSEHRTEPNHWFTTTHWSVVLQAKHGSASQAGEGLARLCQTYWPPIYAYLRREGHAPADAEDLAQGFFVHLFEQDFLSHLRHRQGKFRSFLLKFLKHYLSDERDKARAQKRGGGQTFLSLDELKEEERRAFEPSDALTAEQAYERRWAQTLMERAVARLRREYADAGQAELFDQLKDLQPGERGARSYADIGARLGLSEAAVKSAAHRLRLRHRDVLRSEIAATVGRPEDVDEEIRHLIQVLGR